MDFLYMSKGVLVFSSLYALNVWDIKVLNKNKQNLHSCGAYTVISINNLTKKSMRKDIKEIALPLLKYSIESFLKMDEKIKSNQQLIDALYGEVCIDKETVIKLIDTSKGFKNKTVYYDKTPLSIMFANSFQLFNQQCAEIDILALTGWVEKKKAHELHKRICKPLRSFMQNLGSNVKTLQK